MSRFHQAEAGRSALRSVVNDLEKLLPLLEPEALGRFASKKARDAGQELFDNRAVSDLVVADGGVKGRVKGTRATPYSTGLIPKKKRDGLHLEGHCTCPTFSDGWEQVCHHAVALALELRRYISLDRPVFLCCNESEESKPFGLVLLRRVPNTAPLV